MKKIFKMSLFVMICVLCIGFLASCKKNKKEDLTRVQVDINPSVELIVDKDNKVVSVSALNDDGNVIIVGESIVGKSTEEAVNIIVSVATDTGYIVKGDVTASDNNISISVSGDTKAAEKLYNSVKEEVSSFLASEHVQAIVKQGEALEMEALKQMALKANPVLTVEEVNEMTEQQLLNVIKLARVETALLYSEKLEELYLNAKQYEIKFCEREETNKVISAMDAKYQSTKANYATLLASFSQGIEQLEKAEYDYLISPESDYQQGMAELLAAKKALLEQKTKVAELNEGLEKEAAKIVLASKEAVYTACELAATTAYNIAKASIDALIQALKTIEQNLINLESAMPAEIKTALTNKASEIEQACNAAKNNFFAKFEETHAADIAYYKQQMLDQKAALEEANK